MSIKKKEIFTSLMDLSDSRAFQWKEILIHQNLIKISVKRDIQIVLA